MQIKELCQILEDCWYDSQSANAELHVPWQFRGYTESSHQFFNWEEWKWEVGDSDCNSDRVGCKSSGYKQRIIIEM